MDNLNIIKDLLSFHYFVKKEISPSGITINDTKIIQNTDLIIKIDNIDCRYYIRDLFDFFDSIGIFITILYKDEGFMFILKDKDVGLHFFTEKIHQKRYECELECFLFAFKYLNKKIIKKEFEIK